MPQQPSDSSSMNWPLWQRQIKAIVRLELRRNVFAPRGLWVFFLAFAPALVAGAHSAIETVRPHACSIERDTVVLAWVFQLFYVRVALFFGSLGIFVRLFRGEMTEQTLHYYLLAPLRREVMLVGKYLAGILGSAVLFVVGGATSFVLLYLHHGARITPFLIDGSGFAQLGAYLGVLVLGSIGYGAVFLATNVAFKNPALFAIAFFGWEAINGMLPAALQWLSVTFYLKPLFPMAPPVVGISGLFTVVVEPIPVWLSVVCVISFSFVAVTLGALRVRTVEIDQAAD